MLLLTLVLLFMKGRGYVGGDGDVVHVVFVLLYLWRMTRIVRATSVMETR